MKNLAEHLDLFMYELRIKRSLLDLENSDEDWKAYKLDEILKQLSEAHDELLKLN